MEETTTMEDQVDSTGDDEQCSSAFFSGRFNGIFVCEKGRQTGKQVWGQVSSLDVWKFATSVDAAELQKEERACGWKWLGLMGTLRAPSKSKGSKCKARQATVEEGPVKTNVDTE